MAARPRQVQEPAWIVSMAGRRFLSYNRAIFNCATTMTSGLSPRTLWLDLRLAIGLFTRVPLAPTRAVPQAAFNRSLRLAPVAGVLIGLAAAGAYWAADRLGLPALAAALSALGVTLLVTGALHEDGLADLADGLGGGRDRARKLAIMLDSRVGTYGTLALILSVGIRAAGLAEVTAGAKAWILLLVAHGLSRALLPAVMWLMPLAKTSGLAARVGRSGGGEALTALGLGCGLALIVSGPWLGLWAILCAAIAAALVMTLAARQIGGYTGDVLGAVQQAAEVAIFVSLASCPW